MRLRERTTGIRRLAAGLALCALAAPAQVPPVEGRKPVGLVLGGGAALGLAHVGVLDWLDEHRIPVDAVAGTSMGGLVGGLYAAGYNAQEIAAFVRAIDWTETLRTSPAYTDLAFRRKEDRRRLPSEVEIGMRKGLHLPVGLSAGHGVGLVLSRFTSYYDDLPDFDAMPIPFRCVATDLISGNEVVFSRGRLFDALRSSMALPGVFTPWRLGQQVLVDGGMLNNLPVDVARGMGAEVVIAVVLETPPIDSAAVASILGVAKRSISVMISNNEKRSMANADVVLAPRLKGFSGTDYPRAEEFRQLGYAAADAQARRLLPYALTTEAWAEHVRKRRARRRDHLVTPAELRVQTEAGTPVPEMHVELNQALDGKALEHTLNQVAGLGPYSAADYTFSGARDHEVLEVRVHDKPNASPALTAQPNWSGASGEGLRFGMEARFTRHNFLSTGAELRSDLSLGAGNNGMAVEYYWRRRGTSFFLAPNAGYHDVRVPFLEAKLKTAEYAIRQWSAGTAAGWAISPRAELRAGYQWSTADGRITRGTLAVPSVSGVYQALELRYRFEGQDSAQVARRGVRAEGSYAWVFPNERAAAFGGFDGSFGYARPFGPRYSLLLNTAGGFVAERSGVYHVFLLGGNMRLSALQRNQLFGHRYFYSSSGVLRAFSTTPSMLGRLFAGVFYENGATYLSGAASPVYHNATAGLLAETYLGVAFIGGSVGDKGERKLLFRLGRVF